jgi:hypothetical protein
MKASFDYLNELERERQAEQKRLTTTQNLLTETYDACMARLEKERILCMSSGAQSVAEGAVPLFEELSGLLSLVKLEIAVVDMAAIRAECETINIIIAIALNMLFVWFVIKKVNLVEKILGKGGIYILRKFFGVILLAMSVKLIISNLIPLIS